MGVSELTVLGIWDVALITKEIECYMRKKKIGAIGEDGPDCWSVKERAGLDKGLDQLLVALKKSGAPVAYAAKYIDYNSVAASQLDIIREMLVRDGVICTGILYANKYAALSVVPSKAAVDSLKKGGRRKMIITQKSERILWFHLLEAMGALRGISECPLVLVLHETLGPGCWARKKGAIGEPDKGHP